MACRRLTYQNFSFLTVVHRKKRVSEEKKCGNYYPFGLEQRGYHNYVNPNGNAAAQRFKYNGIELEESLGLNLYEMDMRGYDPAIARWTSIDPVTHHTMSTYTAFDNNPVYWADPSGADAARSDDDECPTCANGEEVIVNGKYRFHDERSAARKRKNGGDKGKKKDKEEDNNSESNNSSSSNNSSENASDDSCPKCPNKARRNLAIMMANRHPGNTPQEFYDYLTNPEPVLSDRISKNIEALSMFGFLKVGGPKGKKVWWRKLFGGFLGGLKGRIIRNIDNVMNNPYVLKGMKLEKVYKILSNKTGWINDVMRKSSTHPNGGWVLREVTKDGTEYTGRLIQYHPGTSRHFNGAPYWKVSNGVKTIRIPAGIE